MKNLIKRHLLLYFGNPNLLFLSLLGALISFLLYLLFLKDTMVDSWSHVSDAKTLLSPWLISGTLTVTAATTTFNGLDQMIRDRESGAIIDFQCNPAHLCDHCDFYRYFDANDHVFLYERLLWADAGASF